jgi:hypothetical protein
MELLATGISILHLVWIVLVVFGAIWTRGRPFWTAAHIACLVWGIVVEVGPWPCPLTLAENYFALRAGEPGVGGSYLLHCVQSVVYPNAPYWVIAICGVTVCAVNLGAYAWRVWAWMKTRRAG